MTPTRNAYAATAREFGESLRKLRKRKRLSVEAFAKQLGMSPRRARAIEAGRGKVTLTDLVNIGKTLKVRAAIVVRPLNTKTRKTVSKRGRQHA